MLTQPGQCDEPSASGAKREGQGANEGRRER